MKMTTEEAFVKVLQMHGIEHAFGIIGSAMMPVSDLFPKAGITFWDCAHETNAGLMADGFTRSTGKMSMAIAQNGPGVTGFVTPIKTAYWNHTPLLLVTPQAANKTIGQGGFQEMEQMRLFADCVCYQEEVRDASRSPEVLNRVEYIEAYAIAPLAEKMLAADPALKAEFEAKLTALEMALNVNDVGVIRLMMQQLVAGYIPSDDIVDWVYLEQEAEAQAMGS